MQDRQQQFNLSQSTSSSSATVTENPTVREQRTVSQGEGSYYQQGQANKVSITNNINDNRAYNQPSGQEKNRSLKELSACLRNAIEKAARENTAYIISPFPEQDLSFVAVDITSETKSNKLDDSIMSDNYLSREEMMKAFKPSKGNMDLNKIFQHSKKSKGKCNCRNPYCHKSIGIVGQAGIGKTTLSMHLTKNLLDADSRNTTSKQNNNKIIKFDYVFFMQFRNMNFETSYTNLLHFLLPSSLVNNWEYYSGNNDKLLLQYLNGDESSKPSVILIMDGIDEAVFRDLKSAPPVTLFQEATAEDFIKSIISGHLLGHATKFITSRPHRMYEMHEACRPHFVYRIVGLSSESQNKLCQQICKDYSDRVGQYLENHPDIQAYCYVPINCILTLHCIKIGFKSAKEGSSLNVNTITDVIFKTFEWFLESANMRLDRDCIGREVQKICRFALNCFVNQRIIFYAKDFTSFEIGSQTIQAFVDSHVDNNLRIKVLNGKKLHYFSHLIWQEFFSAIALLFVDDNFKQHEPEFSDGRWEVVLKFAFGLTNPKISRLVEIILFDGSVNGSLSSKNTSSLQQFATNAISKVYKKNTNKFSKRVTFKSVLQFCVWAHEAQNETLQKLIAAALPLNIVFSGNCIAGDIASLNYVLCACAKPHTVDVKLKFIGNAGKRFLQKIPPTLRRSNSYPEVFDISYGEMDSIGKDRFQPLKLGRGIDPTQVYHGAGLTAAGLEALSVSINKIAPKIHCLNLSENNFGDTGIPFIMSCLDKIEKLYMADCNITDEGVRVIIESIKNCSNLPKVLEFTYDKMNPSSVLRCGLDQLDNANLSNLDLTPVGVEALAAAINKLPQPMKKLNFFNSNLGDDEASHISTCLSKIEELDISLCNISASGVKSISDAISKLPEPIHCLNLSGNKFGDAGVPFVMSCLDKIEKLYMTHCNIIEEGVRVIIENQLDNGNLSNLDLTPVGVEALAAAINKLPQPICYLNLSGNNFGDAGVPFVMSCLDKIEKLYMTDCNITEEGVRVIIEHIKNCSNLPKVLEFSYDEMNRSKVLCCGLDLLDNGNFSNLDLTPVGVEALAAAINKLPEPIRYLNLSGNKFGDAGIPFIISCLDKIENLYMTDCNITEEGVRVIIEHIKNCSNLPKVLKFNYDKMNRFDMLCCGLDLLDNGNFSNLDLTPVGVEALAAAINKLPEPIHYLNLSGNKFRDAGVPFIMSCLDKIEKLYMTNCNITEEGVRVIIEHIKNCSNLPKVLEFNYDEMNRFDMLCCGLDLLDNGNFSNLDLTPVAVEALAAAINKLPQPMKKLNLVDNNLGDDGASHISTCLSKIEQLYISECNISASGIKPISDAISKLPEPMKKLSLYDSGLGDGGASHISTCLSKIEELDIGQCDISASGIKSISDAISKLRKTIRYLNLSENKFGDAGVPFIMSCLDKIEKLYMTDCNITEEGVRVIIEHIKNCSNLPKVLEFNYDKMNRFSVLRCGLEQLDNGNFRNLDLTAVGWEALAAAINKLPQPMKRLDISINDLGDDGASHISTCLSKIEELHICEGNISASGIKSISDAISKLPNSNN
ncbi:unnamed protein product [Clavelina lepadiformis]|uniref:NACHT domain-containing protein n=1 Tax=Clavelina lepadiformis TaxID=159417 RepID=A0ABP0GCS2_CLALP